MPSECGIVASHSGRLATAILQNSLEESLAGAAFYDLEGTLVSTNLVHTLSFYARRQQGLMASFKKSATTFLSLPVFAVTDQYSRKVFNDLYFKRYKGQSEDRLRYFAQELFEDVIKPAVFPGHLRVDRKVEKVGAAAGGDNGRAGSVGQAADGAFGDY